MPAKKGMPENVAFEKARRYAREIVPGFSATAYFGLGIRLAQVAVANRFTACGWARLTARRLEKIDPDATVIFVMNHRSNMDYVLVTYLAAEAGALSYAVGEWARVWPLSCGDPGDGRLFYPAQIAWGALSQGAGPLCADGHARGCQRRRSFPKAG